jgi:hypothetical protein
MAGAAAYLLVSRLKASFAFSSMPRKLVGGSLNFAQHSLANASADSHWLVNLRPPVFFIFHPPIWSQPQSIDQFKEHTLCYPSGEPTNKMSVSSYPIHCRWINLVVFCPVFTHCYICTQTLHICWQKNTKDLIGNWGRKSTLNNGRGEKYGPSIMSENASVLLLLMIIVSSKQNWLVWGSYE